MAREDPKYTVAVCNYNMARTLEESLRSILNQIDERFEVLVVDDGSTDRSQEILDNLESEYDTLRWIEGKNENIGEARAQANREAKGDHILTQMDVDDRYKPIIQDFILIYEELMKRRDKPFYLSASNINVASKVLLEEINYRSLDRGEDRDLWRRLLAKDALLPLNSNNPEESLGYDYSKIQRLLLGYRVMVSEFKSGISYPGYISHRIRNLEYIDDIFTLFTSPLAYITAVKKGRFTLPDEYQKKGSMKKEIKRKEKTLAELQDKYGFNLEEEISDQGKEIFYDID